MNDDNITLKEIFKKSNKGNSLKFIKNIIILQSVLRYFTLYAHI